MKKAVIWDLTAVILILAELVILNLVLKNIGIAAYILVDTLTLIIILFVINAICQMREEKSDIKTNILNSAVLVVLYLMISAAYEKSAYGISAIQQLNQLSAAEEQEYYNKKEEGMEVILSDEEQSGQLLNLGIYFVIAFSGGQLGIKLKKRKKEQL